MFTECSIPTHRLLDALNGDDEPQYFFAPGLCERIVIFTRFVDDLIPPVYESDKLTIRHLRLPGCPDILLAVVHLSSKLYWDADSQVMSCVELCEDIEEAEKEVGHRRTVLLGDFNMHPFEAGLVNAKGLHGVMSRDVASRKCRIVDGRTYNFFYNPMWSLLGDGSTGPAGTYYYHKSAHNAYFWHMFDQVLIRPDLLDVFSNEDLEILDWDGKVSLVTPNGRPDKKTASDHLPIKLRLRI